MSIECLWSLCPTDEQFGDNCCMALLQCEHPPVVSADLGSTVVDGSSLSTVVFLMANSPWNSPSSHADADDVEDVISMVSVVGLVRRVPNPLGTVPLGTGSFYETVVQAGHLGLFDELLRQAPAILAALAVVLSTLRLWELLRDSRRALSS